MTLPPIPHSRPSLGAEEAAAAAAVVASGQLAEGPEVAAFEREAAALLGGGHAVCVSSGTAALYLALAALGAGPGDEVVVPSFVCSALLHAVAAAGARPVPADIDPESLNIDPADARARLSARTKAIIVPHMFGLPADLDRLAGLGVPIIEDCAQAIGAAHRGRLKSYDKKTDHRRRFNFKMTDIQAAIGRVQLRKLPEFIRRRREIAADYRASLAGTALRLPPDAPGRIYFRFVLDGLADPGSFRRLAHERGIGCEPPVHIPLHRILGVDGFPRSEHAWRSTISLPIYPSLSPAETGRILAALPALARGTKS